MEFKTIKKVTAMEVSHNIIARVRERSTNEIQVIFIENWKGTINDFRKEFVETNKEEYSLAWAVFAPIDETKYDEVIEEQEAKWAEIKKKSCEYHKAKNAEKKALEKIK